MPIFHGTRFLSSRFGSGIGNRIGQDFVGARLPIFRKGPQGGYGYQVCSNQRRTGRRAAVQRVHGVNSE